MKHNPSPARGTRGMVTAPHALATQSAMAVLREGGNAVEAMIAAAATIAVVYPHMNSIGGDGFWLIARPGEAPRGLEACGAAAAAATRESYRERGLEKIPFRGGVAANTVAGTISGWDAAQTWSREALGGRLPLSRLLADAMVYARDGMPATQSQSQCTASRRDELCHASGFAETFLPGGQGVAVSFIQSIYHEFGSGVVLAESGVNWQNRGCSFSLDAQALNPLMPGRKPFHTLNPALARLDDGRTLVYGNMGGDGQPQSQSAVFSRIAQFGMNPQAAIAAPRWLLGRTWGQDSDTLKLESRFPQASVDRLRELGHEVEMVQPYDEVMGHAGAIIHHADGSYEGGSDPRSDGAAAGW
jgi:gamma-glutamyltranspeptidase